MSFGAQVAPGQSATQATILRFHLQARQRAALSHSLTPKSMMIYPVGRVCIMRTREVGHLGFLGRNDVTYK